MATYNYNNTDVLIHVPTGIEERTVDLTPALATTYLAMRVPGPINTTAVRKYVADLRNGNWETTYEPISFGIDKLMHSGAARCRAVQITGITIPNVKVHFGLSLDACKALDQGRRRTAADRLRIEGVSFPEETASTIKKTLSLVEHGGHFVRHQLVAIYTPAQVWREYRAHPMEYTNAVVFGRNLHMVNHGLTASICAAIYVYQTLYLGKTDAQVRPFFEQWTVGTAGWAALALNRVYTANLLVRQSPDNLSRQERFGSMGLCWNSWWNGIPAPRGGNAAADIAVKFDPAVHGGAVMV